MPDPAIDHFARLASSRSWRWRSPQELVAPYFESEFNRCLDHNLLSHDLESSSTPASWCQFGAVCRINDMRKVGFGWHNTVFEMLAGVEYIAEGDLLDACIEDFVGDILKYLISVSVNPGKVWVSYFGGGLVLPELHFSEDSVTRNAWTAAGLNDEQLIPIPGPKGFLLFVGDRERAGPKCEILYEIEPGKIIEIGTFIVDSYLLRHKGGRWSLTPSVTAAIGIALGHERLLAVGLKATDLWKTPVLARLESIVQRYLGVPTPARRFLRSDVMILTDHIRALLFLLGTLQEPDQTIRGQHIRTILRRVRRKLAVLCIADWDPLVQEMEAVLIHEYRRRYVHLEHVRGWIGHHLKEVPWPTAWNPTSYSSKRIRE